jgi:hypothetical protein
VALSHATWNLPFLLQSVAVGPFLKASHHPSDAGHPRIGYLIADVTKFDQLKLRQNLFAWSPHSLYSINNIIIKNVCEI